MKSVKPDREDHLEEIIGELRLDCVNELPAVIESLQSHLSDENDAKAREEFQKLQGKAKTYHLPELETLTTTMIRICMEYQHQVHEFLPSAIGLLERIHSSRRDNQPYAIQEDGEFQMINSHVILH